MLLCCEVDIMSKIGVSTARKTKYKPASNNPFQGPMAVSFNYNRPPFPAAFRTFESDPARLVKNSILTFNIERVGGVNRYGDNSLLGMKIGEGQLLTEETGINLVFGVNNNAALASTDGIASIQVQVFGAKDAPLPCLGPAAGPDPLREIVAGVFTKAAAETIDPPVTLRDGDNFSFNLQQAVEATGVAPEEATGTLYITPEIQEALREPGSTYDISFVVNIIFNSSVTDSPVALDAGFRLRLFNTE
jgi:hypothetical protein